jgi:hypothetical protein
VPLLTTPTTVQLSRKERQEIVRGDIQAEHLNLLAEKAASRLADEPLDATALWLWSVPQDPPRSRRALDIAQKVSLRETTVQLELMRIKALAGDLPASLAHLDNAMLVSSASRIPILQAIVKGLDQPNLVRLLKPYGSRPWYKLLLQQSVYQAPRPENAADLLLQTELSGEDVPPQMIADLLSRLVAADRFKDAAIIAKRFASLRESALASFAPTAETMVAEAAPLTWAFSEDANLVAERVSNGVFFDIERGQGGTLMTRVTSFPPGNYTLRQTIEGSTSDLAIKWELQCLADKDFKKSWSQGIPANTQKQIFDTNVTIQKGCGVQRWELLGFNQSGEGHATLSVTMVDLLRQ